MKNILLVIFIFSVVTANAQQVAPDQNIPTSNISTQPALSSLPDLADNTNQSLVNYVRTYTVFKPGIYHSIDIQLWLLGSSSGFRTATSYFDGLGRPQQDVIRSGGNSMVYDWVQPYAYNSLGQEEHKFLPYTFVNSMGKGKMDRQPETNLLALYNSSYPGEEPYSKTEFQGSQLNRIKKVFPPGNDWVGSNRGKEFQTFSTSLSDGIRVWRIDGTSHLPISNGTVYSSLQLLASKVIDEDGNESIEYKDKLGRLILKKAKLSNNPSNQHTGWSCTYYVYDLLGRLRFVLPPKAIEYANVNGWVLTTSIINDLCYSYKYNKRGQVEEKKVPGKEVEYFIYDKRGRLVLRQDGNLRMTNRWAFTIYDQLDRSCITGTYNASALTMDQLKTKLSDASVYASNQLYYYLKLDDPTAALSTAKNSFFGYPGTSGNDPLPEGSSGATPITSLVGCEILTQQYYDKKYIDKEYDVHEFPYNSQYNTQYRNLTIARKTPKGMLTATRAGIIDRKNVLGRSMSLPENLETRINYYDRYGNKLQEDYFNVDRATDHGTLPDRRHFIYDFEGNLVYSHVSHSYDDAVSNDASVPAGAFIKRVEYDIDVDNDYTTVNGTTKTYLGIYAPNPTAQIGDPRAEIEKGLLVTKSYDRFNRIKYHNLGPIANERSYNVRSWLTGINESSVDNSYAGTGVFFAERLSYNNGFASKNYNGRISGMEWRHYGSNAPKRFYGYTYDNMNRLTDAEFGEWTIDPASQIGSWSKAFTDFTMSNTTYDIGGNIETMMQMGPGPNGPVVMDDLVYNYDANTNILRSVNDAGHSSWAPDFEEDQTQSGVDYKYDPNGNLIVDLNKQITNTAQDQGVSYNVFDLPNRKEFKVDQGGNIVDMYVDYVYDGFGNLLAKKKWYPTGGGNTELYRHIGEFEYKDNVLLHFSHQAGRSVTKNTNFNAAGSYSEDYIQEFYVKDHLNNVRAVVEGTVQNVSTYPAYNYGNYQTVAYNASFEPGAAPNELLIWTGIDEIRVDNPLGTPQDLSAGELIGGDPAKGSGCALLLHAMAGDYFEVDAESYYDVAPSGGGSVPSDMIVNSLLNAFSGGNPVDWGTTEVPSELMLVNNTLANPNFATEYQQFLDAQSYDPSKPDAYLNYIVFDENFKMVTDNSGTFQAGGELGQWTGIGTQGQQIEMKQNGYILVFVSNKSSSGASAYFNNVNVNYTKGELKEETHYYPFGLTLRTAAGAAPTIKGNQMLFGTKRLENLGNENWYDFGARRYDMQLGRWLGVDPMAEKYAPISPYNYALNNPANLIDPDGRDPSTFINEEGVVVGGSVNDGDRGVYLVPGLTKGSFDESNIQAYKNKGSRLGETYSIRTFLAPEDNVWRGRLNPTIEAYENITKATGLLKAYVSSNRTYFGFSPSGVKHYMSQAGNGGDYDIKAMGLGKKGWDKLSPEEKFEQSYEASFFGDMIMTRRDQGNYFAGRAARITGLSKSLMLSGYGGYQSAGNKKNAEFIWKSIVNYGDQAVLNSGYINNPRPIYPDGQVSEDLQRAGYDEYTY